MIKLFFFLFASITFLHSSWIEEQIKEDEGIFHTCVFKQSLLRQAFQKFSQTHHQVLYCTLRNNQVFWESSPRTDSWRNKHIFAYFEGLSSRFKLPDTDFILLTEDGALSSMPVPIFAFSKHALAKNVYAFPDFEALWEVTDPHKHWSATCKKYAHLHPWNTKVSRAFFRGADTGGYHPLLSDFGNDRVRAVIFSSTYPHLLDATLSSTTKEPLTMLLSSLGKKISSAPIEEHFHYKYLLDIDGHASTYSRMRWILFSNSTLVKISSPYRQWYYKSLKPWIHYVPIRQDLSDAEGVLTFLQSDDELAFHIAENGRALAETLFSQSMVDLYIVTLLKAYAKKISL